MTTSEHLAARLRAFELIWEVQDAGAPPLDELDALLERATQDAWSDVQSACLLARLLHARWQGGDAPFVVWVDRLHAVAEESGDDAMLAAALASRALGRYTTVSGTSALEADAELARALALLDTCDSPPLERVNARLQCALGLYDRGLWELQEEQYALAEHLLPEVGDSLVAPVLIYNRASVNLTWALALRCVDPSALPEQLGRAREVLQQALELDTMPHLWRQEVRFMGLVIRALAGEPVAEAVEELQETGVEGPLDGNLPLALALAVEEVGLDRALEAAREASQRLDRLTLPAEYETALCLAAEWVARRDGVQDGLVYARHLAQDRWRHRVAALDVMRARLEAERRREEHDQLLRQAHLDPLTGLANRRGLARYLDSMLRRGQEEVSVLAVDLDLFKQINDRFGHGVGDEALVEVAQALSGSVRAEDLACRLGGDEFMVVLATANPDAGRQRGEQVLGKLAARPWQERHPDVHISVSIGIGAGRLDDWDGVLARADAALYVAKEGGRGRVSGPLSEPSSPAESSLAQSVQR
ncbi:MAG: GGDEF domain-containing protein [Kineosporiaceae bacterium]|nr:GGDEF domain-containing protein [Kineosporiaceae bacterium]